MLTPSKQFAGPANTIFQIFWFTENNFRNFYMGPLTLPISRNSFDPSRTDKGRVAMVCRGAERVAVAATMPGPFCFRDFDLGADQGRRRQNGRTAQVHVRATARTNGKSVGTSDASWDMQQAEKSIACGTQALSCFCGGLSSSTARPCALRAYGRPVP